MRSTARVEIQRAMRERNAGIAEDERIAFRIGINLGDVIVEGDDIYGDGVNVAARLEALAEPAASVSRALPRSGRGKLELDFEDLASSTVKNIARPIHVYRHRGADAAHESRPRRRAPRPRRPTSHRSPSCRSPT